MCSGHGMCADDSNEAFFRCFCCPGRGGKYCQMERMERTSAGINIITSRMTTRLDEATIHRQNIINHHGNGNTTRHGNGVNQDVQPSHESFQTTDTISSSSRLITIITTTIPGELYKNITTLGSPLNGSRLIPSSDWSSELQFKPGLCNRSCSNNKEVNHSHACSDWMECKNGGKCVDLIGSNIHYCQCLSGFTGTDCSFKFDLCLSKPCPHICLDYGTFYECECYPGYEGNDCSDNLDECNSNPCHNGGTCVDLINKYSCICTQEYSGSHCQHGLSNTVVVSSDDTNNNNNLESFLFHHPQSRDHLLLTSFKHSKLHSLTAVLVTLLGSLTLTALVFLFCYCSSSSSSSSASPTSGLSNQEADDSYEEVENKRMKRCFLNVKYQLRNLRRKIYKSIRDKSKFRTPIYDDAEEMEEDALTIWKQATATTTATARKSSKSCSHYVRNYFCRKEKLIDYNLFKKDKKNKQKMKRGDGADDDDHLMPTGYSNHGVDHYDGYAPY